MKSEEAKAIREERERRERQEKLAREQYESDFKWFMSTPQGRRLAAKWLKRARVYLPSFNVETAQMSYHEGRRATGLELLGDINVICPDEYIQMLEEERNARSTSTSK